MHDPPLARTLATLLALGGCVDVERPFRRAIGPRVAVMRANEEAAARARFAALPRIPMDQRDGARVVAAEGGVAHCLMGPLRFDARGADLTPAEDVAPEPILAAERASRGWVFVTRSAVYASETFTGRLRGLRSGACARQGLGAPGETPWLASHPSRGRVALTGRDEGALWSDGRSLHEVGVPGAVGLAWRDDARGAVVVGYRALRVTRDGGRSWRDVDTHGEVPVAVRGDADGLRVETDAGSRRIDDRDALVATTAAHEASSAPLGRGCALPPGAFAAVARLVERGYEVAPAPPSREPCERARARRRVAWSPPRLAVRVNLVTRRDGDEPTWTMPDGVRSPFGSPGGRTFAETGGVPAVVNVAAPVGPVGGRSITLSWRAEDDRGPFTTRVRALAPGGAGEPWTLVAATRRGLLFEIAAPEPRAPATEDVYASVHADLFWFSADGVRRTRVGAWPGRVLGAVPLDDGGCVALGSFDVSDARTCDGVRAERTVAYAMRLGPDGAVLARRAAVDDPPVRTVVGLGSLGARRGLVVAEGANPEALTLLPFGGEEISLGTWHFDGTLAACGDPAEGVATLHLLRGYDGASEAAGVVIGPQEGGSDFASPRLTTVERASDRVCVRRVWAAQHSGSHEVDVEDVRDVWAALRLTARRGRLEGTLDDGAHVATLSAALGDVPGSDSGD